MTRCTRRHHILWGQAGLYIQVHETASLADNPYICWELKNIILYRIGQPKILILYRNIMCWGVSMCHAMPCIVLRTQILCSTSIWISCEAAGFTWKKTSDMKTNTIWTNATRMQSEQRRKGIEATLSCVIEKCCSCCSRWSKQASRSVELNLIQRRTKFIFIVI